MIKIKPKYFESVLCAILVPNTGLFISIIFTILSLIVKQETIVIRAILISYVAWFSLLFINLFITVLVRAKDKNVLVCTEKEIIYLGSSYKISDIVYCKYYSCKWYLLPIAAFPIYKEQLGGLIVFRFSSGEEVRIKIFYKDYLKFKKVIPDIVIK